MQTLTRQLVARTWLGALAWTAVLAGSLYWNLRTEERQTMELAYAEARANLNKDGVLRRWATGHGGVYVPVTERQKPEPALAHIPERDVTTPDGRTLTLLNPATIVRQMMDRYATEYGVRGRITGLKFLNPDNAPDAWERRQLEAFTNGDYLEVWAEAEMDGTPHLRYLRAMYMEQGCEKCHAILGYQLGDMRGATGINLPLTKYLAQIESARRQLGFTHGAIWLLGLAGIGLSSRSAARAVRARVEQEAERDRAERRFRALFEHSRDGILTVDLDSGRFLEFNAVAHRQLGYSREEFATLHINDIDAIETPEETAARIARIRERGWDNFETQHRSKDGSLRDVQVVVQTLDLEQRPLLYVTYRDITERKVGERAMHLYGNIFRHSGEAIMITDQDNRIVSVNPAFTRLTGYEEADVRGQDPKILGSGRTPADTFAALWKGLRETGFWQGELWDRRKDGSIYPKWTAISALRDGGGAVTHYIASFTDVSERKASEERIDYLARHDALTGLPNRYALDGRLGQVLAAAHRDRRQAAVMFIDLDRFKVINDTLGHDVGDQLLIEVARRLGAAVRESDVVARLGGDEFVVVLTGLTTAADAAPAAHKILHNLRQPYDLSGHALHSSPSIGVAIYPDDGLDGATLMKNADLAMYHAKEQGRNNMQFFTASMNEAASERLMLERELRAAIAGGQLELHYQPQVCARDGRVFGVEALLRWRHPRLGMVPPLKFVPVAEASNQIEALGLWVLEEACRQWAAWRAEGVVGLRMAVNLSAHQLRSPALVDEVGAAMARHGLGHGDLELEVTESAAMENPERAIGQLTALRALGVRLAIDDFGTGYSSLAYLKMLPIQTLKLDRAFVRDIETDSNDAAISAATLALAHSLGLKVVAEGVETEAQRHFLSALHQCEYLQGYLFGRPEPAAVWSAAWKASPDAVKAAASC